MHDRVNKTLKRRGEQARRTSTQATARRMPAVRAEFVAPSAAAAEKEISGM
jgi:hypothetical protein